MTAPRRGVGVLCLLWGSYGIIGNSRVLDQPGRATYRKPDFPGVNGRAFRVLCSTLGARLRHSWCCAREAYQIGPHRFAIRINPMLSEA